MITDTDFASWMPGTTDAWLVKQRNAGHTPDEIARGLVDNGWAADAAATTSLRSLRKADHHRMIYIGLCWGAGLAALALATALHLLLAGGAEERTLADREELAFLLTSVFVIAPIAIGCGIAANRVERTDRYAIWSPTRRSLFGLLAGCTGFIGIVRLLGYTYDVMAAVTGAADPLDAAGLVQVLVSLSIAGPLFAWSLIEWRRSNIAIGSLGEIER